MLQRQKLMKIQRSYTENVTSVIKSCKSLELCWVMTNWKIHKDEMLDHLPASLTDLSQSQEK